MVILPDFLSHRSFYPVIEWNSIQILTPVDFCYAMPSLILADRSSKISQTKSIEVQCFQNIFRLNKFCFVSERLRELMISLLIIAVPSQRERKSRKRKHVKAEKLINFAKQGKPTKPK